jgi:hypothetical protein
MKITTKSGAVYSIDNETGILKKTDAEGTLVSVYKVFFMKAVPLTVTTWDEVYDLPNSEPEVGKLLYTSGKDDSWLSTEVVSIDWEN